MLPLHPDPLHDATSALTAARLQVDMIRRALGRGSVDGTDLDAALGRVRASLDRIAAVHEVVASRLAGGWPPEPANGHNEGSAGQAPAEILRFPDLFG
jgi:hypothetical protein